MLLGDSPSTNTVQILFVEGVSACSSVFSGAQQKESSGYSVFLSLEQGAQEQR